MKEIGAFLEDDFWFSDEPVVMNPGWPERDLAGLREFAAGEEGCRGGVLFSTSGSSGPKKWVVLSRAALRCSAEAVVRRFGIGEADVFGLALPVYHVGGVGLLARTRVSGAKLARFGQKWSAGGFTDWVAEKGVTLGSLVPAQVNDLVAAGCRAPESLRAVVVGGGRFEADLQARARDLGWPVLASYGMTETASQVATERVGERGMALFEGWEARVAENGRLSLRGGSLLSGYVKSAGARKFFFEDPKAEGWFETSDFARLEGGEIEISGRADRQVKVLGELVDLEKIEAFFRGRLHCEVRVRAEADERSGARLFLRAEGRGAGDLEKAVARYHAEVRGFERLAGWEVVPKLKRGALGKVMD